MTDPNQPGQPGQPERPGQPPAVHETPGHPEQPPPVREAPGHPLVAVTGLAKSFGDHEVLTSIDFEVHAGSVTVLIGPSGSGKTTVLRSLNTLETPDGGVVRIGDVEVDFSSAAPKGSARKKQLAALRDQSGMSSSRTTCSRT